MPFAHLLQDSEIWAGLIRAKHPFCCICHHRSTDVADHVVPVLVGGTNTLANGQGLCRPCRDDKRAVELFLHPSFRAWRSRWMPAGDISVEPVDDALLAQAWTAFLAAEGLDLRTLQPVGAEVSR